MSRPYGFHSLPYQTQMSIRRSESDVKRARGRAASTASEVESLRQRVAELEAENERLSKAVMGGILPDLLDADETDALVDFVKHLRATPKEDNPMGIEPVRVQGDAT